MPNAILRVEDREGKILWQPAVRERRGACDRAHAWLMTDVLRDVVRRGTAAGSVGARINFPAGGKTGTTNDGFDVWFIGFTPDLVTGVWMGFDKPKKIKGNAQGGVLAAPAWTAMMREVYERGPIRRGLAPSRGLTSLDIDKTTGYKATPFCPKDVHYIESFIPGTEPTGFCPIHRPFGNVGGVMGGAGPAAGSAPLDRPGDRRAAAPTRWARRLRCRPARTRPGRHRRHGRDRSSGHSSAVACRRLPPGGPLGGAGRRGLRSRRRRGSPWK